MKETKCCISKVVEYKKKIDSFVNFFSVDSLSVLNNQKMLTLIWYATFLYILHFVSVKLEPL